MSLETIRLLYGYTAWADERTRKAVAKAAPEPFTRNLGSSHASLRDTVVHLASGQWMWLSRWEGTSPKAMWDPALYTGVEQFEPVWKGLSEELGAFVAKQTEESLRRDVKYANTKGEPFVFPLWKLMLHLVNHSTYHRGQVTTLLRQLGLAPAATDLSAYLAQT